MALRFRNERVINSLRSAYSATHRDDSLLLTDSLVSNETPEDREEFETYIAGLVKSQQDRHHGRAPDNDLQSIRLATRADSIKRSDTEESIGENMLPSFSEVKDFGLSIDPDDEDNDDEDNDDDDDDDDDDEGDEDDDEDESDFEGDMLRATQEIKHNKFAKSHQHQQLQQGRGKPRADSRFSQKSSSSFTAPEVFVKRSEPQPAQLKSQLTSQLTATQRDPREQYLEATTGLKMGQSQGLALTMHMKGKPPLKITVKDTCSAHLAIGFALLTADAEIGDANMYNLYLVEDDGEPDEDFPALDRTRPIASYQVDEFALVKATEQEYRENSKRTPNKVVFKKSTRQAQLPPSTVAAGPDGKVPVQKDTRQAAEHGEKASAKESQPSQLLQAPVQEQKPMPSVTFSSMQPPSQTNGASGLKGSVYDKTGSRTSVQYATSFGDSRNDFVIVKVYMYPYDPILSRPFWTDEMVLKDAKIAEVFEQMCREKLMDSEMYVLRKVQEQLPRAQIQSSDSAQTKLDLKAPVSSLVVKSTPRAMPSLSVIGLGVSGVSSGGASSAGVSSGSTEEETPLVTLEVVPKRQLQGPGSMRRSESQPLSAGSTEKHAAATKTPTNELQNAVLAMQPLGFYKYPVIRRQQMNFLGRSERDLVIDGEYIHIMPPTDWSLLDQPKTTTFHIRQVVRIKQSRKVRTNVSIVVMKPSGPKRYDLETKDKSTASEIVEQLVRLKKANAKPIL